MSDQDRIEQAETRYEVSWAGAQRTIALSSLALGTVLTLGGYIYDPDVPLWNYALGALFLVAFAWHLPVSYIVRGWLQGRRDTDKAPPRAKTAFAGWMDHKLGKLSWIEKSLWIFAIALLVVYVPKLF